MDFVGKKEKIFLKQERFMSQKSHKDPKTILRIFNSKAIEGFKAQKEHKPFCILKYITLVTAWRMDGKGPSVEIERQIKGRLQYFRKEMTVTWTGVETVQVGRGRQMGTRCSGEIVKQEF